MTRSLRWPIAARRDRTRAASTIAVLLTMAMTCVAAHASAATAAVVAASDNTRPAGVTSNRITTVRLVVGVGKWRPEGPDGREMEVAAFGEAAGQLSAPGPMIRVPANSEVVVSIMNGLDRPLTVHGLLRRPAATDTTLTIAPGEVGEARFLAGAPGTYEYWGTTTNSPLTERGPFDSQLGGAFIVDDPTARIADRVFVITGWGRRGGRAGGLPQTFFTINGQSWPFTERLRATVDERLMWRWVNLSTVNHPLHLHGFYFTVTGTGSGSQHRTLAADQRREVVTENLGAGNTIEMEWTPDRPGQWLFHCHTLGHISPNQGSSTQDDRQHTAHTAHDPSQAMAGLVMGITVTGNAKTLAPNDLPAKRFRLAAYRRAGYWGRYDAYAFALEDGDTVPTADDISVPGAPLILTRGQPVEITVTNHMPEPTSVHWHGIELDSYYDGVPGFSGTSTSTTPLIEPGESFVVKFRPRRAGTFIYHTHSHDNLQLASGLYGAIVVLEPGQTFDPVRDHVLVIGMTGPFDTRNPARIPILVNGKEAEPSPLADPKPQFLLEPGVPNRLRIINITTFSELSVSLMSTTGVMEWQPSAKDGAELPMNQQAPRPAAAQVVAVGETYDFLVTPNQSGPLWLEVRYAPTGMWIQQVPVGMRSTRP